MPNVIVTPHAAPFALGNVRRGSERFLDTYRRVGMEPFRNMAYREQLHAAH